CDRERKVSKYVQPADEAGNDQDDGPPHEWRNQTVNSGPRPGALKICDICRAAFQKKLGHEHAHHAQRELQPGIAKTERLISLWLLCHVEGSRGISYCSLARRGSENKSSD